MLKIRLFLFSLLICLSLPAQAFVLWYSALPALTEDDLRAIMDAGEGIEKAEPGTTRNWMNEKNGHSGTLTLVRTYQEQGKSCRTIRHHIEAGFEQPWVDTVHTCQDAKGRWVLHPQGKGERQQ
jgi:surface antigen